MLTNDVNRIVGIGSCRGTRESYSFSMNRWGFVGKICTRFNVLFQTTIVSTPSFYVVHSICIMMMLLLLRSVAQFNMFLFCCRFTLEISFYLQLFMHFCTAHSPLFFNIFMWWNGKKSQFKSNYSPSFFLSVVCVCVFVSLVFFIWLPFFLSVFYALYDAIGIVCYKWRTLTTAKWAKA